jgi:hypothetical protein
MGFLISLGLAVVGFYAALVLLALGLHAVSGVLKLAYRTFTLLLTPLVKLGDWMATWGMKRGIEVAPAPDPAEHLALLEDIQMYPDKHMPYLFPDYEPTFDNMMTVAFAAAGEIDRLGYTRTITAVRA